MMDAIIYCLVDSLIQREAMAGVLLDQVDEQAVVAQGAGILSSSSL
jgi:hypothetical protein